MKSVLRRQYLQSHDECVLECFRDELKQCRSKIIELEAERNETRDELQNQTSDGNQ
ncbi:hypothetical protein DPMN_065251 [Dreissena polymorpha]|uniref:Uncharacterized protein n=1 Tax=Dreissena polymorpha TaxID=45954 RepID=A0A9D4CF11_DREPO|nr:hypothetical protein DPMN_065251 [Dreissena polymorpha]